MTEDFVIKYFWSAIGYGLMSIPIFFPTIGNAITQGAADEPHDPVAARAEGDYLATRRDMERDRWLIN